MYLVETVAEVERLAVKSAASLAYVTQTTLSMDDASQIVAALRERFPEIQGPKKDDICYATQNRQDAVKALSADCDVVVVVGSPNSSNSNRLREVAIKFGRPAYLVDRAADLAADWFVGARRVGVTAGASAPDVLVEEIVARLIEMGAGDPVSLPGIDEAVNFPLPRELA